MQNQDLTPYVAFNLQGELFGIEISKVFRVIEMQKILPIPKSPDHILGIVHQEGEVIPLVDLGLMIDLEKTEKTESSKIIILNIEGNNNFQVGAVIDAVKDVVEVNTYEIQKAPTENLGFDASVLEGMYKENDDFVLILDMERVFLEKPIELNEKYFGVQP